MKIDNRLIVNRPLKPNTKDDKVNKQNKKNVNKSSTPFKKIFQEKIKSSKIEFSKHAKERLKNRNINLNKTQMQKLQKGVEKAESKGAKDSLILVDDVAYIVSVKNNKVVTAIDGNNMKEKVFTNIDSTVLM
ncbi:MAG TPA: TIGR02530 family flagellar biosynthesis protein [Halanaerobiales bacterium]|nr:TIGR02530 family flagellar biosynthesis protein [Halanaerobiales bacterium]